MVLNIFEYQVKNPSSTFHESVKRMNSALVNTGMSQDSREDWYCKLNYNIDYWKKHGKLPNNADMARVQGKGDAYTRKRI